MTAPARVRSGDRTAAGASLAGRTIRRDGVVLSGVTVAAADGSATRSGADGHFVLSGLPRGVHTLHAEADGLVSVPTGAIAVRGGETIDGIDLVLDQPCFVSGCVSTGPNQALAAARVSACLREAAAFPDLPPGAWSDTARIATSTDADGRFRLGPFVPGRVELTVEHDAVVPFARLYPSDASEVQITLGAMSSVSGVVLDPDGKQPAIFDRVLLMVSGGPRGSWVVAAEVTPTPEDAAAGRFHLPVPIPQPVCVVAVTRDFAPARSDTFRVPMGKAHGPLELRASAGTRLTGRIHDAAGTSISGAEIRVREQGVACELAHATAGADGRFSLHVTAGRYVASIRKPGFSPRQMPVEVAAGQAAQQVDCTLVRGAALSGRIVTAEGAVLPALDVLARNAGDTRAAPEIAMVRDGAYCFDFLTPGDYQFALRERGDTSAPVASGQALRLASGDARTLDLTPRALGLCRLHGSVIRNGAALPFATIHLVRAAGRKLATATADRSGQFEFDGLAAGVLTLTVSHGKAGPMVASRRLELRGGDDREERITVEYGSVAGRLVTSGDKAPGVDVRIDVVAPDGRVMATARSGQDGRFSLPMVQAGCWTLVIERASEGPAMRQAVQVAANRVTQVLEVEL